MERIFVFIGVYLDVVPPAVLLLVPFWGLFRVSKKVLWSCVALYMLYLTVTAAIVTDGWIWQLYTFSTMLLGFILFFVMIKSKPTKMLYVTFVVATYTLYLGGITNFFEARYFPEGTNIYGNLYSNLIHMAGLAITMPLIWRLFRKQLRPVIIYNETPAWKIMWTIPAIFLVAIFNLYGFEHTSSWRYFIMILILAFGSFLIYYVALKMIILTGEKSALEQIARTRAEMVDTLSHEVRTPLTVMSTYAQLAVKKIRAGNADEQTLTDLVTISYEAKRLSVMASNTLRLSRLAGTADGAAANDTGLVDIGSVTVQLVGLFEPTARRANRKLNAVLSEKLPPVWGESDALTRLLWNILDNALTHSERGDIEVRAEAESGFVRVVVKDEGAGIPPDLLPKVFERGVSGKKDGTGLGLAFCREIAERHGGSIFIESEYGMGATVMVTLPAHGEDANKDD